jgi:hypothetical protein
MLHTIHGPAAITSSLIDRDGLLAELTSHARCAAPEVWSRSRLAWLLQTVWQAALIGGTLVAVSRLTRWFYRHLDYHHVLVIPVWVRGRHTSDDGWWCEFGASVVGMSYALGLLLALQAMLLCAAARRAAQGFHRTLAGAATPQDDLRPQLRLRLARALAAFDGAALGWSYRDIATEVFGSGIVAREAWRTSTVRDATIRLVRAGRLMVGGGYRSLLWGEKRDVVEH